MELNKCSIIVQAIGRLIFQVYFFQQFAGYLYKPEPIWCSCSTEI